MKFQSWKSLKSDDFKKLAWGIYPKLGFLRFSGCVYYKISDLKNIPLNERLSFPHKVFVAIDKSHK